MTTHPKPRYTVDFAITLTLSPHLYTLQPNEQAHKAKACFEHCISNVKGLRVSAFMEETKNYNIHIHAILSVPLTDYIQRYTARRFVTGLFRNKNWGKVKDIDPVHNFNEWTKYIIKDVKLEREYYPVIRDDYDLLLEEPSSGA